MKPHIYRFMGIWHCVSRKGFLDYYFGRSWSGLGYTPLTAYQDWLALRGAGA